MKHSLKATSIIESIVVLIVVVTGIVGVYNIMISSQRLSNSTADRIEAIQIARDGLEAVTNIRDTNWQLFAADYENCWNTLNYDASCIGNAGGSHRIQPYFDFANRRFYRVYKNSNSQFELEGSSFPNSSTMDFTNTTFRNFFRVGKDINGFYSQGGSIVTDFSPIYIRYIRINYPFSNPTQDRFTLTSIVEWFDPASESPRSVELSTTLTNWKAKQ